jgi:hypothetical protein
MFDPLFASPELVGTPITETLEEAEARSARERASCCHQLVLPCSETHPILQACQQAWHGSVPNQCFWWCEPLLQTGAMVFPALAARARVGKAQPQALTKAGGIEAEGQFSHASQLPIC